MILTIAEHILTVKLGFCDQITRSDMYFTLPVSIVILFAFIFNHPHYQSKKKTLWFRNFATLLFFTQFYPVTFAKSFLHLNLEIIQFLIVLVLTITISLIILWVSNIKNFSFIQRLYS